MIFGQKLKQKIEQLKAEQQKPKTLLSGKIGAGKLLIDLFSGLMVGAFLGYSIDVFLGTLPLLLFICVILGMIGGFYNSYKTMLKNIKEQDNA